MSFGGMINWTATLATKGALTKPGKLQPGAPNDDIDGSTSPHRWPYPRPCSPHVLGESVVSGEPNAPIPSLSQGLDGAVFTAVWSEVLQGVGAEQVLQRSGFADAARGDVEANVLGEEPGCGVDRQHRDVLSALSHRMAVEAGDVGGVIEGAICIRGDGAEVELAVAAHAGPAGPENMGSPCRVAHALAIGEDIDCDSAVDDGDEVPVGQCVKDGSRPRSVDAADDEIEVECQPESGGFADAVLPCADGRVSGGGILEEEAPGDVDFGSS